MSKQFKFLDWNIYVDSKALYTRILSLANNLPREQRFEITSQLLRACLSVSLNIAEGSGRSSDKDLPRYLDISLGSLYETLACLDILSNNKQIDGDTFISISAEISSLASRIGGFKKSLL